jgi:phosphoribosylglycinamide formyltransferase-1
MEAILASTRKPDYPAEICLVLSDNPKAAGLETARSANIEVLAFARKDYTSRSEHETAIMNAIDASRADLICLAGYMRILSADFTKAYEGRLINIHPSLLPKYKGLDTHQRALDAGDKEHGCTVHFVNSEMDGGEIIAQAKVAVLKDDTADTLADRVLIEEHKLYSNVIANLAKT